MGYTHYYRRPTTLPTKLWAPFIDDVKKIVRAAQLRDIDIHDGLGEPDTHAVMSRTMVRLNGTNVDDQGHETLFIPRVYKRLEWERPLRRGELRFQFCKTARKPYDAVVGAILIAFVVHFGALVEVSSDGRNQDWDWVDERVPEISPMALYREVFPDRQIPSAGHFPWNRLYDPQ